MCDTVWLPGHPLSPAPTCPRRCVTKPLLTVTLADDVRNSVYSLEMDHGLRSHDDHGSLSAMTPTSGRGSKRNRDNETLSQRTKREKAAERQRRKRERDREAANAAAAAGLMSYPPPTMMDVQQQQVQPPPQVHHQQPMMHPHQVQEYTHPSAPPMHHQQQPQAVEEHPINPEEEARKERVRAAARERQRKHRALVKARKMRELGLDMGNEVLGGVDETQYRVESESVYQPPVMMPSHDHGPPPGVAGHPGSSPIPQPQHEPPFPQNQPLGGQTFASTLLLSFSCAPLLKQHLLRTLSMTNEELASLEPVIAAAWDQWDYNVCYVTMRA
jgi:hypothetical protein